MKKFSKKLLAALTAVTSLASISLSANAEVWQVEGTEKDMYGCSYDNDGNLWYHLFQLFPDNDHYNSKCGYLYIMEDAESKPAVETYSTIADIYENSDEPWRGQVSVSGSIMNKYGNVYHSMTLAEDKTGISKIIKVSGIIAKYYAYMPWINVTLKCETEEEFNDNSEEILKSLFEQSGLEDDGYGFCASPYMRSVELNDGKTAVQIDLKSAALEAGVETEVSKIFENVADNVACGLYKSSSNWEPYIELVNKLNDNEYVIESKTAKLGPDITLNPHVGTYMNDYAYCEEQILYDVVYSADGSAGDANNDGLLELADVQTLLSHKANSAAGITEPIVSATPDNMDVDGDGEVTIKDAQYLLTYCAQQAAGMNPTWESVINA